MPPGLVHQRLGYAHSEADQTGHPTCRGMAPFRCGNAQRGSAVLRSLAVSAKCIAIASSGFSAEP
jgi:hypothetical protein